MNTTDEETSTEVPAGSAVAVADDELDRAPGESFEKPLRPPRPETPGVNAVGSLESSTSSARLRAIGICAGVTVLTLLLTQFALPGSVGSEGRGTPAAILFTGFVLGMINSLIAAGMILIYRTSRVINFAQTAIGVLGATLVFDVVSLTDVPFVLVLPLGIALSALAGMLFELALFRRFFYSSRLVLTVVTIVGASLFASFGPSVVRQIPFIPYESQSLFDSVGARPIRELLPFRGFTFEVGDLAIEFGFPEVFAIEAVIVSLLLVAAFFRFTRAGVAVRALAENSERASLLGISIGAVSMTVWAVAGALGGVAAIATGAVTTPGQASGYAPGLLVPALAAATIARFRSFPVAVFVSVLIGVIRQAGLWSFPDDAAVVSLFLFALIAGGLLLQRTKGRSEESGGVSWQAVEETRPVPKELAGIGTVRAMKYGLIALGVIAAGAYPFLVSTGPIVLGSLVALTSIIVLSLVVLTGWAGQVSLGQYAFAAVGGVLAGALTARVGIPFWFSVLIAPALTGAFAALVGLPALRIKGLFLAVTTFAFNVAIVGMLFSDRYFGWLRADDIRRPTLFFIDFSDERSMYYLCVGAFGLSALLVANLRRTRFGRVLIALRENENNVQAFGVNVIRTKLTAFAVAGALAGFGGAMLAFQQQGLNQEQFLADRSLQVFLYAVVGGISSVPGAMLGSLYYNITAYFNLQNPILDTIFKNSGPFFLLLLLYVAPGGLISIVTKMRDGVLRIIAQRRQIIVPSLFADYDAEALERRLIPLAEAAGNEGLRALPGTERYTLASELYAGSGERIIDKLAAPKKAKELVAIGAASESMQERELLDITEGSTEGAQR